MWGGVSSQIVKAVLDNIGRRYLVEHTEADDGSWWADRYSDGWVVQGGYVERNNPPINITFPIAFSSVDYSILALGKSTTSLFGTASVLAFETKTQTGFVLFIGSHLTGSEWIAQGYAA